MERATAIKTLGKLLGKGLGYRVNDKAPSREERAIAKAQLPAAIEARNKIKAERDARYAAILAGDQEYQRLRAEHKAAEEHVQQISSLSHHYKFTVGTTNGMFFHVKAEGDSWEEVINKLTKERAA